MSGPRAGEEGFVLIAVIWFVALTALVAILIAGWMSRSLALAARLQDRVAAHAAAIDAQNEIEYRLVSGFLSIRGLEMPEGDDLQVALRPESAFGYQLSPNTRYLALDDRPYRLGKTIVRLQDDRGLYSLDHPDPAALGGLLRHYGIDYNDRAILLDRLLDYLGRSNIQRLNGATAKDYAAAGRPAPRGAALLTPWEALRVLSWDDYPALWREPGALPDVTTIGDAVQLNPNTASPAVLATLPGMDEDAVQRVLRFRQTGIMQTATDFEEVAGAAVAVDPMALMFFPSNSLEVGIAWADDSVTRRLRLRLTGNGKAPLRVDYDVDLPAPVETRLSPANIAKLPQIAPSAAPATAEPTEMPTR